MSIATLIPVTNVVEDIKLSDASPTEIDICAIFALFEL